MAETITPYLRRILAPNPGPMTLEGTNTWILGDPELASPVVVDPGPLDDGHLEAILDASGGSIEMIVLTHRHADHSESAAELAHRAGCDIGAADSSFQVGHHALKDRDAWLIGGAGFEVFATPGHTSDSCSLLLRGDDGASWLLTGDMVLGRGTTVIADPDGDLTEYFASLDLLEELVREYEVAEILPGHGPRVNDPAGWLAGYRRHRLERLDQVRAALAAGDRTAQEVVERVYADVDRAVWPAAEASVRAQLAYIDHQ